MYWVLGPNKWTPFKVATKGVDVKGTSFDIHPNHSPRQPLRIQNSRLDDVEPHIYDMLIRACG